MDGNRITLNSELLMCGKIFTLIFTTNFVDSLDFRTSREVFPIEVMSPEIPAPTMKHISSKSYALLAALPLAFLAIFYFYPLIKILTVSLTQDETWGFGSLKRLITRGIYLRTLWFTTWQAVVSTILTLLLALPGAYVFARYRFRGKELLRSFTTVPFVLPTVVVAAACSLVVFALVFMSLSVLCLCCVFLTEREAQ